MHSRYRLLPVLLSTTGLAAQCVISTQLFNGSGCGAFDNAGFSVNTTGGTAPYTIVLERHSLHFNAWLTEMTVTNDADGALFDYVNIYATDQLRVTVTDALGCIATQTNTFQACAHMGSFVGTYGDPCTGLSVVSFQFAGTNCTATWMMSHTLFIDGTPVGDVASTCTTDGTWFTINQQFSNGTHSISFSGLSCMGNVTECWDATSFTVNSPYSGDCGVNFHLRAALDGALPSGTLMSDALRAANLVPTLQPYTALGYVFVGSPTAVSTTPALLAVTGNDAIVDWVAVEVRNTSAPYAVVYSKPALIQRDGDVIDADGHPYVNVPISPGSYRIALRHRNHLGVMTGSNYSLVLDPEWNIIDLRLAGTSMYGVNPRVLKGSVYCLWAGDANGNGTLAYTGANNDRDLILLAIGGVVPTNTLNNVYLRTDLNMDGVVKYTGTGNDRDLILTNIGGVVPTNTRLQQLP